MVFFLMPMGIRKSHHPPQIYAISDGIIYCLKLVLDKGTSLFMGLSEHQTGAGGILYR